MRTAQEKTFVTHDGVALFTGTGRRPRRRAAP